jgi:hypothetical protein
MLAKDTPMNTTTKRRAYGKLRDIIERRGGTMVYQKRGYRHGAWEILLDGKRATFVAMGCKTFPPLDRLYIPAVPNPKTWDDYREELVADAEYQLCSLLG